MRQQEAGGDGRMAPWAIHKLRNRKRGRRQEEAGGGERRAPWPGGKLRDRKRESIL